MHLFRVERSIDCIYGFRSDGLELVKDSVCSCVVSGLKSPSRLLGSNFIRAWCHSHFLSISFFLPFHLPLALLYLPPSFFSSPFVHYSVLILLSQPYLPSAVWVLGKVGYRIVPSSLQITSIWLPDHPFFLSEFYFFDLFIALKCPSFTIASQS